MKWLHGSTSSGSLKFDSWDSTIGQRGNAHREPWSFSSPKGVCGALFALAFGFAPIQSMAADLGRGGIDGYTAPPQVPGFPLESPRQGYVRSSGSNAAARPQAPSCNPPVFGAQAGDPAAKPPSLGYYLSPSISVGEFYSDNINLAPDSARRSDSATILTPSLKGCTAGSRLRAQFDYSAQAIHYARETPKDKYYNRFNGTLNSALYPDHLYFDASGSYGQTVINPGQPYSGNDVFITRNRTNTWNYQLSPYWRQGLGRVGLAVLRYDYGRTGYSDSSLSGSRSFSAAFDLTNPPDSLAWSWHLHWKTSRVKYDQGGDVQHFDNAYLSLGYLLFPNLQLLAKGGLETEYQPDGTVKRYGSHYGSAGFKYANGFASLAVTYGWQYFGHVWSIDASYRLPRLLFGASYAETTTSTSLQAAQTTQSGAIVPLNQPQIINAYISKRASGSMTYLMPRSRLVFTAYDERRYYRPSSIGHDRTTGGSVDWKWRYNTLTAVNASFSRERLTTVQTPDSPDFINQASLGITRMLLPNLELSLNLLRQSRSSHIEANTYTANSAAIQLTAHF